MKKNKRKKQNKKKLLVEKNYEYNEKKKNELENDINKILDDLSVEELTELEEIGDFSEDAIEWIRARKKRKKERKTQLDFEQRIKCSDEVRRRTELIGKVFGFKNGLYKPKSKKEAIQLKNEIEQDIEREDRQREKIQGDSRSSKSSGKSKDDRER